MTEKLLFQLIDYSFVSKSIPIPPEISKIIASFAEPLKLFVFGTCHDTIYETRDKFYIHHVFKAKNIQDVIRSILNDPNVKLDGKIKMLCADGFLLKPFRKNKTKFCQDNNIEEYKDEIEDEDYLTHNESVDNKVANFIIKCAKKRYFDKENQYLKDLKRARRDADSCPYLLEYDKSIFEAFHLFIYTCCDNIYDIHARVFEKLPKFLESRKLINAD